MYLPFAGDYTMSPSANLDNLNKIKMDFSHKLRFHWKNRLAMLLKPLRWTSI